MKLAACPEFRPSATPLLEVARNLCKYCKDIFCKKVLRQVILFLAAIVRQSLKGGEKQRVQGTFLLSKKLNEEDSLTRLFLCDLENDWLAHARSDD